MHLLDLVVFPFVFFFTTRQSVFSLTAWRVFFFLFLCVCFVFFSPNSQESRYIHHTLNWTKKLRASTGPPVQRRVFGAFVTLQSSFFCRQIFLTTETGRHAAKAWLVGIVIAEPALLNKYRYVELASWCTTPVIQCNLAAVFLLLLIKLRFDCCVCLKLTDAVSSPRWPVQHNNNNKKSVYIIRL